MRSLLTILVLVLTISCKQTTTQCCHTISNIRPVVLGFVGYDSVELKNMVMKMYKWEDSFQNPYDSVLGSSLEFGFVNDTALKFNDNKSLWIHPNTKYTVEFKVATTYRITSDISKDTQDCYIEQDAHCPLGASQPSIFPVKNIRVNGELKKQMYNNDYIIFLTK